MDSKIVKLQIVSKYFIVLLYSVLLIFRNVFAFNYINMTVARFLIDDRLHK